MSWLSNVRDMLVNKDDGKDSSTNESPKRNEEFHDGLPVVNANVYRPKPVFFEDWPRKQGQKQFSSLEEYDAYFDPKNKQLSSLWKERKLDEGERLGL